MNFKARRLVKPGDLNPRGTLFGGQLLAWIDEEAAIFCKYELGTKSVVTKLMSEINFMSPAYVGDVVTIGIELVSVGTTSIILKCSAMNQDTDKEILNIDKFVFVSVDRNGVPKPHGIGNPKTE
jgi:acyl-CoA hydrolase